MKDHDYIMEHKDLGNDKFTASGEREIDRWLLNKIAGPEVARLGDLRNDYCRDPFDRRPYPIGLSRASLAAAAGLITFRKRKIPHLCHRPQRNMSLHLLSFYIY